MHIGVRAHLNGIAWSSEFRTVVQRLVYIGFGDAICPLSAELIATLILFINFFSFQFQFYSAWCLHKDAPSCKTTDWKMNRFDFGYDAAKTNEKICGHWAIWRPIVPRESLPIILYTKLRVWLPWYSIVFVAHSFQTRGWCSITEPLSLTICGESTNQSGLSSVNVIFDNLKYHS